VITETPLIPVTHTDEKLSPRTPVPSLGDQSAEAARTCELLRGDKRLRDLGPTSIRVSASLWEAVSQSLQHLRQAYLRVLNDLIEEQLNEGHLADSLYDYTAESFYDRYGADRFLEAHHWLDDAVPQITSRLGFSQRATAGTVDPREFFARSFGESLSEAIRVRALESSHEATQAPSRAYRTFEELAEMLGQTTAETAKLLDLSRGTVYAWKAGREPQPRNARRLYRTNTLMRTLTRRLGHDGVLHWLVTGDPTPLELLARGDFAELDRRASPLIFSAGPAVFERVDAHVEEQAETELDEHPQVSRTTPAPKRIRRPAPRRR
jgi:hypothetical protein